MASGITPDELAGTLRMRFAPCSSFAFTWSQICEALRYGSFAAQNQLWWWWLRRGGGGVNLVSARRWQGFVSVGTRLSPGSNTVKSDSTTAKLVDAALGMLVASVHE